MQKFQHLSDLEVYTTPYGWYSTVAPRGFLSPPRPCFLMHVSKSFDESQNVCCLSHSLTVSHSLSLFPKTLNKLAMLGEAHKLL